MLKERSKKPSSTASLVLVANCDLNLCSLSRFIHKTLAKEKNSSETGVFVKTNGGRWIKHYCSSHRILLLGKRNFSFSACLAKAFCLATNMVATSLDSLGFFSENYKDALSNIVLSVKIGCNVIHGVDATTVADHNALIGMRFVKIVLFNFPLSGFDKSLPQSEQIKKCSLMLEKFMLCTRQMGFFQDWEMEKLALQSGLHLIEQSDFSLNNYPGYRNK